MAVQQQKENYQRILDKTIEQLGKEGKVPSLLLHSCCAPCSSYVLEYLSEYFKITVLYYNPNISPKEEYEARVREQKRLIGEMDFTYPVSFLEGNYVPEDFYDFLIWKHLSDKPRKEARVIGDILGTSMLGVGDWWYAKRIEYYIDRGDILIVEDSANTYARVINRSSERMERFK